MNIFLTGGSGGIGREIVRALAAPKENTVYFTFCQNVQQAEQLVKKFRNVKALRCDLSKSEDIERVKKKLAGVEFDVIINNAFPKFELQEFTRTSWAKVQEAIDVGVKAHFEFIKEFSKPMVKKRQGSIITILSSVVLNKPPAQTVPYVIAKYAMLGFHQALVSDFVKWGLRVNAISPVMVRTDFLSNLPDHYVNMVEESMPSKKLLEAADVAGMVKFCLSRDAAQMNGVNIPLTGGG